MFQKSGAFKKASELGIAVIGPDTSPRGIKIEGDSDSWDFGVAAGFYLDATNGSWAANYRMYSYITKELYGIISSAPEFASFDSTRMSITGHRCVNLGSLDVPCGNWLTSCLTLTAWEVTEPSHCS
jgi:S-formylglutathione hydrolase